MRRPGLSLLVLLLALQALPAPAVEPAGEALLRSARMWEIRNRPDLQRLALEKYLLAHPDDAQALHALGQLEIRSARFDVATRLIEQLKAADAQSRVARDLADAYRLATRDRLQMATVHRLIQLERYDDAVTALRQLFPQGAPGGEIGIDYYNVIDSAPRGWPEADRGLRDLLRDNPDDPKYMIALAQHLTRRAETRPEGFRLLAGLVQREDADRTRVFEAWRAGLSRLPDESTSLAPIRQYLALNPDDGDVRDQLQRVEQAAQERQRRLQDPGYRLMNAALADLDAGRLDEAEAKLLQAQRVHPADAEIAGNLGRLRLRQGRHAEAAELFRTAAAGDRATQRSKWTSLTRTARFWGALHAAGDASDRGELEIARAHIRSALELQPRDSDALAALADNTRRRGDAKSAEKIYRDILARDPADAAALRGLARLYTQSDRRDEALAMLQRLRKSHPRNAQELDGVRAGLLRDEAQAALAAGRRGEALRGFEAAQAADPADPWIRFDLARLYRDLGLPRQARELMAGGVERSPGNADARYAYALMLASLDEDAAAARQLQQIPATQRSESMRALQRRLQIAALRREAFERLRAGDAPAAVARLQQAEHLAGEDLEQLDAVAATWTELGQAPHALNLLRSWMQAHAPVSMADRMVWARALNRASQEAELASETAQLRSDASVDVAARKQLDEWEVSSALRQARERAARGHYREALQLLTTTERAHPGDLRIVDARADVQRSAGDIDDAIVTRRALQQRAPQDFDNRVALARLLREDGQRQQAEREIDQLLQDSSAEELPARLALLRLLTALKPLDRARVVATELLEQYPDQPDVLIQAGRVEEADRQYERALAHYRRAQQLERAGLATGEPVAEPAPAQAGTAALELKLSPVLNPKMRTAILQKINAGLALPMSANLGASRGDLPPDLLPFSSARAQSAADAAVQGIEQRRDGFITAGWNHFGKSGDPGTSSYDASELAIEIRVPRRYHGHWFALIDPGALSAETLPAVYDAAALHGKVQAFGPGSLAAFPNGAEQQADGTAIGVGYETDDWRVDLGTTPLGFLVEDVVGGIQYDGELGELDWRLDLSRRPVTSSFLSYAGARDPVTGDVWGGVRSSGLDARLAYYGPRHSLSGSLGFHHLQGRNVPGNAFLSAGASSNWRVLDAESMRGYAGFSLTYWNYAKNLSQYTFGHGGYYSPQSYVSLGLPLEWTGRWRRLAYQLRGSVSVSYSSIDSALFYPGDAALQAAATGMPLPTGFSAPVYGASSGSGTGHSLKGALEYQVSERWFVGGHLDVDRSAFYAPNFGQLYLRYHFDPQRHAIEFPPRPPRSYSRF